MNYRILNKNLFHLHPINLAERIGDLGQGARLRNSRVKQALFQLSYDPGAFFECDEKSITYKLYGSIVHGSK